MTSDDYVSYSVCYEHYAGATVPARKLTPLTTCILMSVDKKRQRKELKYYMLHSLTQYRVSSLYVLHSLTQYMVSFLYVLHSLTQYIVSSLYVSYVVYRALHGHPVSIKRHRQL